MRSGLMVVKGGSMASRQLFHSIQRWKCGRGRTDRDRGDSRKGGNHFPVRVHRIVAFELVLFTCCQLVLSITIFPRMD
jgi:hypothetical protein